jgi:hypothetical protein
MTLPSPLEWGGGVSDNVTWGRMSKWGRENGGNVKEKGKMRGKVKFSPYLEVSTSITYTLF